MYATQFSQNFKTTRTSYLVETEDHCKVHNQIIHCLQLWSSSPTLDT